MTDQAMTWEKLQCLIKAGAQVQLERRMKTANVTSIESWSNSFKLMRGRAAILTIPGETALIQTGLRQWSFDHEKKEFYIMVKLSADSI